MVVVVTPFTSVVSPVSVDVSGSLWSRRLSGRNGGCTSRFGDSHSRAYARHMRVRRTSLRWGRLDPKMDSLRRLRGGRGDRSRDAHRRALRGLIW